MEEDGHQILESLLPELGQRPVLNFPQDNFVPEQLFDDSSSSEIGLEDVLNTVEIKTSDETTLNVFTQHTSQSVSSEVTLMTSLSQDTVATSSLEQQTDTAFVNPANNGAPPLRIAAVPVSSDIMKQGGNRLIVIPVGGLDPSTLQSSLKVPVGQNIVIIKPKEIIKKMEEKKLKIRMDALSETAGRDAGVLPQPVQNIVSNQQSIIDNLEGTQAQSNMQVHQPSEDILGQADMQASVTVEDDTIEQPSEQEKMEQNNTADHSGKSNLDNNVESTGVATQAQSAGNVQAGNQAEEIMQVDQVMPMSDTPQTPPQQSQPISEIQVQPILLEQQEVLQTSQSKPMISQDVAVNSPRSANQGHVQNLKPDQNLLAVKVSTTQTKPEAQTQQQTVKTSPFKPMVKMVSIPTSSNKATVQIQRDGKDHPYNPATKASQTTVPRGITQELQSTPTRDNQTRAVIQIPRILQRNYLQVKKSPEGNSNRSYKMSVSKDARGNVIQTQRNQAHQPTCKLVVPQIVTTIIRPAYQAVTGANVPASSLFRKALAPSCTTTKKPPSNTPSVWPSIGQNVVALGNRAAGGSINKPTPKDQPGKTRNEPILVDDDKKPAKVSTFKGPTLLKELERQGPHVSSLGRLKSKKPGESQLSPLKHVKVSNANPWKCSLCGKTSFESSLGCLFGPYNETKDVLQGDNQAFGRKRRHDSTSDETTSPTKLNSTRDLWFHGACIVWSPGIYAVGDSLAGYKQAVSDGRFRKCSCCGDFGATLVCFERTCKKLYHFFCAKKAGCSFEESNYTIQCGHHK